MPSGTEAAGDAGYKAYRLGTHRTATPAETVARIRPVMRDMGITRIANVTGLDRIGIPVVMVTRPNSRSIAVSQGKGLDLDAARASGLMEAVEGFHAERITLPLRLGSQEDLAGSHRLVDVGALPGVSWSQFQPALPILWIEARDLADGAPVWLPYEVVHTNYTLPLPQGSGCFAATTNGLASGNHPWEAVTHGICEVVERDSTCLWHHLDRPARGRTRIDLNTVDDESCDGLFRRLARAGLTAALWNTTSDLGIPSFYGMILDEERPHSHLGVGAGCHPSKTVALLRAMTEAVQVRTTYITGSRDDLSPEEYTASAIADKVRKSRALLDFQGAAQDFRELPTRESQTCEEDVRWMLGRLEAAGLGQVAVVDLTREDFRIPVVRVVIPGLEGLDDDESYVPGARARALLEARP